MTTIRSLLLVLLLVLTLAVAFPAVAGPGPKGGPVKVLVQEPGQLFCPSAALVFQNIVIQPGRCYVLFLMRDSHGTFLAFAAREAKIPPGQLVRLTTPAGAKLKGRIFFLVPIQTTAVLVPVDTIRLVPVRIEDAGPKLSIVLIGTPNPNVTVIFSVRL